MASSSPAEVESLRRQVNSLSFQLVRLAREHEQELAVKDKLRSKIITNRDKRSKQREQLLANARTDNTDLRRSLNSTTAQLEAKKHQVASLQQEVETLCSKLDEATAHIQDLEQMLASRPVPTDRRPRLERVRKNHSAGRGRLARMVRQITTKAAGTGEGSTRPPGCAALPDTLPPARDILCEQK